MKKIQGKSTLVRDSEGLSYLESTVFWGNLHVHSYPIPPILFSSFHLFIVLITNNCLGNCKEKLPLKHCQLTIGYRLTVNSIFHSHIFLYLCLLMWWQPAESYVEEDISVKMKKRAFAGYGIEHQQVIFLYHTSC